MTIPNRSPWCGWKCFAGGGLLLLVAGIAVPVALRHQAPADPEAADALDLSNRPDQTTRPLPWNIDNSIPLADVPQPGKLPKTPALSQSPPRTDKSEPARATRAPNIPLTVVPLGGGRLLHPGAPGLFHHSETEDWLQIVKPAEGCGAAKQTDCT